MNKVTDKELVTEYKDFGKFLHNGPVNLAASDEKLYVIPQDKNFISIYPFCGHQGGFSSLAKYNNYKTSSEMCDYFTGSDFYNLNFMDI
jgi:hypothetical protein